MLLGNPHVIEPVWKFFLENIEAGPFAHRSRNRDDPLVLSGQLDQRFNGDLGIGWPRRFLCRRPGFSDKRRAGMEPYRILHRRLIAQPFFRNDMEQHRPLHLQHVFQGRQQVLEVMSFNRSRIPEPKLFKKQPGKDCSLGQLFSPASQLLYVRSDMGDFPQQLPCFLPHLGIKLTGEGPVQIGGDGADVFRDRHLVVIQDDQEIFSQPSGMVQALQRHTGCHSAVADDAHDLVLLFQLLTRLDHAVGRGYAGSRMTGIKRIVFTFLTLAKAAHPTILPERVESLATPGQQLMHVGLIAGVPHDLILGGIEQIVQCDR